MSDPIERQDAINEALKCRVIEVTPAHMLIDKTEMVTKLLALPSAQPEPCEDDKGCSNCMYSGRPTYKSPCSECRDYSQWEMEPISRSHENSTECEDAVSRADVEAEIANILKNVFVEYRDIAKRAAAKLSSVTPKRKTWEISRSIDGNALVMWLNDWWYSSFGQEETPESKAIHEVLEKVAEYVEKAED